jgi:hypothetical protein
MRTIVGYALANESILLTAVVPLTRMTLRVSWRFVRAGAVHAGSSCSDQSHCGFPEHDYAAFAKGIALGELVLLPDNRIAPQEVLLDPGARQHRRAKCSYLAHRRIKIVAFVGGPGVPHFATR